MVKNNLQKGERLFTRSETLDYFQITAPTLMKWVEQGIIKRTKINRRVYFTQSEINRVLTNQTNSQ